MLDLTITLPWVPIGDVSPNSRKSRRTANDSHRSNSQIGILAVRDHFARETVPWTCPEHPALDITVYWREWATRWDPDNAVSACKGIIDGVTRELGFDDRRFVAITLVSSRDPDKLGYTTLTIREATEEERRRAA